MRQGAHILTLSAGRCGPDEAVQQQSWLSPAFSLGSAAQGMHGILIGQVTTQADLDVRFLALLHRSGGHVRGDGNAIAHRHRNHGLKPLVFR